MLLLAFFFFCLEEERLFSAFLRLVWVNSNVENETFHEKYSVILNMMAATHPNFMK